MTGAGEALTETLCSVECMFKGLMASASFLLVTMAALVYVGGQLGDAQTRAKAQGWATMGVIGAVIGFLILTIGPEIIGAMFPDVVECICDGCGATGSSGGGSDGAEEDSGSGAPPATFITIPNLSFR